MVLSYEYRTLAEMFKAAAASKDKGIRFIEGNDQEVFLSYSEIYNQALTVAALIRESGMKKGDELVFQLKDNKHFIITFWACILYGVIPVPLAIGISNSQKQKIERVWKILNNPYLITAKATYKQLPWLTDGTRIIWYDSTSPREAVIPDTPAETDIAYVQFSSGSTGDPKGVVLTHSNLIANIRAIHNGIKSPASGDLFYSWMPLTHDMGLIGFHLTPLYAGWHHYLMPTELFIRNPNLWLKKLSEHKITFTSSPNFGYRYVLRHLHRNDDMQQCDLSSVRVIVNGAEPISSALCHEFTRKLATLGLRKDVIFPVYGLAEASLAVSFSDVSNDLITTHVKRTGLNVGDRIIEMNESEDTVCFVEVGSPVSDCNVRIRDDSQQGLDDGYVGNIQISGANVTTGYYNNDAAFRKILTDDGWLDTGDIGFFRKGQLYITGRRKDVLVINGQNYYSHDIERLAEQVPGIELGKIVVSGYYDDLLQREKVLIFVAHKGDIDNFVSIAINLKQFIPRTLGFEVDEVLPVPEIYKTTSGKLQRFLLVENYINGLYANVEERLRTIIEENVPAVYGPASFSGDVEISIASIWSKILGHAGFGRQDNFFEVGGNSLKSMEMAAAIEDVFNIRIPLTALYEMQYIAALAVAIQDTGTEAPQSVMREPSKDHHPLSAAQLRQYYIWETDRTSVGYNVPLALALHFEPDIQRLKTAFRQLIERHEILRTTFLIVDGQPVQRIHDHLEFELIESISINDASEHLRKLVTPFHLHQAPLFRSRVLRTGNGEYILFLDFHHIITDGLSVYRFVQELFELYQGVELPAVTFQYKDFVGWEQRCRQAAQQSREEAFWLKHLEGSLPVLNLPVAHKRPSIFTFNGKKLYIPLDGVLQQRLKTFASRYGLSLHALWLGIYHILLSKYTGQEDIIIGVPASGRLRTEFTGVLGMFVNTLAIRNYPDGQKNIMTFLREVKAAAVAALDNQTYDFTRLLNRSGQTRDTSRNAIFDTMLVYQNMDLPVLNDKNGLTLASRYFFDPGLAKYDLTLEIFDTPGTLELYIEYNTDLFGEVTIQQMANQLQICASQVLNAPEKTISEISVLSKEDETRFIGTFNNTIAALPDVDTIIELFDRSVRDYPGKCAIVYGSREYTYTTLDEHAKQLAAYLNRLKVQPGQLIAILVERSPEFIIGVLAILKAGCAFLSIDHEMPAKRIAGILENSKVAMVLTKEKYLPLLQENTDLDIVLVDGDIPAATLSSDRRQKADSPAYVIYTSGTTGQPKGVLISNRALINYAVWAAATYFDETTATIPLHTSISFDLTITSIFPPLITGRTILIYGEDEKLLPIEAVMNDNQADVIKLTPSHMRLLRDSAERLPAGRKDRLKRLIVGGEALSVQLANDLISAFGRNIGIYNEYGPTEATVGCMIYKFDPGQQHGQAVPIGVPISNTAIYLVDKYLKPVPYNVEGRLYIAGTGLADGYLHNEELTNEKFIANPFMPGTRMYSTGDIARRLPDGNIDFIGRADGQIKLNGYRIELSEVESQLKAAPGIRDAVVVSGKDGGQSTGLCAYLVLEEDIVADLDAIQHFMYERLPGYMVPTTYLHIETIPLTINGKVDTAALSGKYLLEAGGRKAEAASEKLLAGIWSAVLNAPEIGVDDDFFLFGGDSIKALQIVSRLYDKGVVTHIKDILRYRTIRLLVPHLTFDTATYTVDRAEGEFRCTPVVNWFLAQEFEDPGYYCQSVLLKLSAQVDHAVLEKAFDIIIRQHDGLRINYNAARHSLFYNPAHLNKRFVIEKAFISSSDKDAVRNGFRHIGTAVKSTFDIEKDLLIRGTCIYLPDGEVCLLIAVHHLVIDAVSWRILLGDLYTLYTAISTGTSCTLPAKTASMSAWAKELAVIADSEEQKSGRQYWNNIRHNAGYHKLSVPPPGEVHHRDVELNVETTGDLLRLSANNNMPLDAIVLTALLRSLNSLTGEPLLTLELEGFGRAASFINISRTIGWFTALYPVTFSLKEAGIPEQLLSIKEQVRAVPDGGIGYGIHEYLSANQPERPLKPAVRFNYLGTFDLGQFDDLFALSSEDTGPDVGPRNHTTAGLEVNCSIQNGVLKAAFIYDCLGENIGWYDQLITQFGLDINDIVDCMRRDAALYFTPSDFETTGLSQEELDGLFM